MRAFAGKKEGPTPDSQGRQASAMPRGHFNQVSQGSAVRGILGGSRPQYKLAVGAIDDACELEADRVADEVMRMPGDVLHRRPLEGDETPPQSKRAESRASKIKQNTAFESEWMQGGRQALLALERVYFEPRLGHDFGQVRIHSDAQAEDTAHNVNARAFTFGTDIIFGSGQYRPESDQGTHLPAHDLTHVTQQGSLSTEKCVQRQAMDSEKKERLPTPEEQIETLVCGREGEGLFGRTKVSEVFEVESIGKTTPDESSFAEIRDLRQGTMLPDAYQVGQQLGEEWTIAAIEDRRVIVRNRCDKTETLELDRNADRSQVPEGSVTVAESNFGPGTISFFNGCEKVVFKPVDRSKPTDTWTRYENDFYYRNGDKSNLYPLPQVERFLRVHLQNNTCGTQAPDESLPQEEPGDDIVPQLQPKLASGSLSDLRCHEMHHAAIDAVGKQNLHSSPKAIGSPTTPIVQGQRARVSPGAERGHSIVQEVLSSPGRSLDASTRGFFEQRFEWDFGHVRIHTDPRAAELAREVNALAFTVGRDVVFGAGEYVPGSTSGRRLLAHELTHVVQQAEDGIHSRQNSQVDSISEFGQVRSAPLHGKTDKVLPAEVSLIQRKKPKAQSDNPGEPDLIEAVRSGDTTAVGRLINEGADINQGDEFGITPLIWAVDRGELPVVELLLNKGANMEVLSAEAEGETALKVAVRNDATELIELLLKHGANMDTRDNAGLNAPSWAAREGKIDPLKIFLNHGFDINRQDTAKGWEGYTLLMQAAEGCQLKMVKWLLQNGADPSSIIEALKKTEKIEEAYEWKSSEASSLVIPSKEQYRDLQQEKDEKIERLAKKITQCKEVIDYLKKLLKRQSPEQPPQPPVPGV